VRDGGNGSDPAERGVVLSLEHYKKSLLVRQRCYHSQPPSPLVKPPQLLLATIQPTHSIMVALTSLLAALAVVGSAAAVCATQLSR
jgi:hypothetical protein